MYQQTEIIKKIPGTDEMVLNVGPQHPATHGVLHLLITINGETIQKIEPHLGYIHRSIEKCAKALPTGSLYTAPAGWTT